jgi:hypothetical protein
MRSILLIDDKQEAVDELTTTLSTVLHGDTVEIRTWVPSQDDDDPYQAFLAKVNEDTTLVVTDSDLTSQGQLGLFGASIVAWCQQLAIPVGDYSRNLTSLPKAPELFELRVPPDPQAAATYVAAIFKGFRDIGDALAANDELIVKRSPSAVLAALLNQPDLESQIGLYAIRLGPASGALMHKVEHHDAPSAQEKRSLLNYVAGHLLLNVLRFPGPILSLRALKAYVASDEADAQEVVALFDSARYSGPFSDLGLYFGLTGVDAVIEKLAESLPQRQDYETSGEFHRAVLESALKRKLSRHECPTRCFGKNGGFLCPFTDRTVCERPDCSVGSNSWLPQGAKLCRIEKDFFRRMGASLRTVSPRPE